MGSKVSPSTPRTIPGQSHAARIPTDARIGLPETFQTPHRVTQRREPTARGRLRFLMKYALDPPDVIRPVSIFTRGPVAVSCPSNSQGPAPSLHRPDPTSPVLRAGPSSCRPSLARPIGTGCRFGPYINPAQPQTGRPALSHSPSSLQADTHTPARPVDAYVALFSTGTRRPHLHGRASHA